MTQQRKLVDDHEKFRWFSREWQDALLGIAQQGYEVTWEAEHVWGGSVVIKSDEVQVILWVDYGVWAIREVKPVRMTYFRAEDDAAIALLHELLALAESAVSAA